MNQHTNIAGFTGKDIDHQSEIFMKLSYQMPLRISKAGGPAFPLTMKTVRVGLGRLAELGANPVDFAVNIIARCCRPCEYPQTNTIEIEQEGVIKHQS